MSQTRWELLPEYRKDPKMVVYVGGYRPGEGKRVALSAKSPFVEGEAYAKYEGTILRRVGTSVGSKAKEGLRKLIQSARPVVEEVAADTTDLEADEPELVMVVEAAPVPVAPTPEVIMKEEPEFLLPPLETLSSQPKAALMSIVERLGLVEKIIPTGAAGTPLKSDLIKVLESYYATLPEPPALEELEDESDEDDESTDEDV
jgi:hypothetical protein